MTTNTEIQLLLRAEFNYNIPAQPVILQLIAESERPLPDVIPPIPQWVGKERHDRRRSHNRNR